MIAWLFFGLTLLLEAPVWWWFHRKQKQSWLYLFFLLNLFTWPILQFLVSYSGISVPVLELGVGLVEAMGIRLLGHQNTRNAFLLSFLANACSYGIGECINLIL